MIEQPRHVFSCKCKALTDVETCEVNRGCVFECPACGQRWKRVEVNMRGDDWIKA